MKTPPKDLLAAAKKALKNAYMPYSHFPVGAAIRAEDGSIFVGCNVENASFPMGICAEGGAISALIANGHKTIKETLVLVPHEKVCPPCGACRQRLLEFSPLNAPIYLCTTDGLCEQTDIETLLPLAFRPENLEK